MGKTKTLELRSWLARHDWGGLVWCNKKPKKYDDGWWSCFGVNWAIHKDDDVFPEVKSTDTEPTEIKFKFNIEFVDKDKK